MPLWALDTPGQALGVLGRNTERVSLLRSGRERQQACWGPRAHPAFLRPQMESSDVSQSQNGSACGWSTGPWEGLEKPKDWNLRGSSFGVTIARRGVMWREKGVGFIANMINDY